MAANQQEYHKASNAVVFGGVITFIALLLLTMSFTSPYWIQSYQETFSHFKHMGLWHYCFDNFRFPYYQFDKTFDGCHHVFSNEYYVIRKWLLPPWLMVVQTFVTIALILSICSSILITSVVIRYPLRFALRYEWLLSGISFCCNTAAGVLLFLAVSVFGGMCWRRDWMMYPNFNYLSWSYGLAVISFMFHFFGAFFFYLDARAGYKYRKESRNLVMQMQPNPQSHHGSQRIGYI